MLYLILDSNQTTLNDLTSNQVFVRRFKFLSSCVYIFLTFLKIGVSVELSSFSGNSSNSMEVLVRPQDFFLTEETEQRWETILWVILVCQHFLSYAHMHGFTNDMITGAKP